VTGRLIRFGIERVPGQISGDHRAGWLSPNRESYARVVDRPDAPFRISLSFGTVDADAQTTTVTTEAPSSLVLGDGEARAMAIMILKRFGIDFDSETV
jgi:hypothetical protein